MRKLAASSILLLCSLICLSQTGRFSFINYNISQGLPDNNIQCLTQDTRGFLWVGTSEGLSRYDGKSFKNFFSSRNDTVIKTNDFTNLYEFRNGHLAINNFNRVICFNTYTEQFYHPSLPESENISLSRQPGQNGYFLSCINKAYITNDQLVITDSITTLPEKGLKTNLSLFHLEGRKELLAQYGKKFYLYSPLSRKYQLFPVPFANSPPGSVFYVRYYDSGKQELYLCDYLMGLYRYSFKTGQTERLQKNKKGELYALGFVYEIVPKKKNELWLLTEAGISVLNTVTDSIYRIRPEPGKSNSLAADGCYTACTDRDNNLWIGTSNGISKLNSGSLILRSWSEEFATSLTGGLMSVVKGPDQMIYASVYYGKAYQLNPQTGKVKVLEHPLNAFNWNLFVRGDEVIRTGRGNQLLSYNTKTGKFTTLNYLQPFYPDVELVVIGFLHSNGDEWYCANRDGGFARRLAGTNTWKTYKKNDGVNSFHNGYYTSYTEDKNGDLWFGVNKSSYLLHWNLRTDKFESIDFTKFDGVESKAFPGINAVTHDAANNIWIGYNGGGLVKYIPSEKKAVSYSINDGLPTNFISGLAFDNNNRLWLNTFKGLSCFIIKENKFVNFKKEDGLIDDYFSDYCIYFDSSRNQLWTGANSALIAFTPDELLKLNRQVFPVYTDEITINGRRHTDTLFNNIALKSWENNLLFHFTGVDLSKGKDIEYSYKLEGADYDWIYTGENQSASYANLKPGTYVFTARARHKGDNRWNLMQTPVRLTIATPWNKTWWFRLLALLFAGLLLWFIIRAWYLRRIEKEKSILEKKQAIEKERTRIATDMHDDFGASLSRIKFLSEKLQLKNPDNPSEKADLEKISLYSDEMAEKMNEIVWALNQRYDSFGDLVSFCRSYASEYLLDKNIRLSFSAGEQPETKVQGEIRRNIFLVIKEALQNIVKHAGATDVQIIFSRESAGATLNVTISDNGKGIDPDSIRPFANGLENMKKRMADVGGTFSIESGKGTRINISVPV